MRMTIASKFLRQFVQVLQSKGLIFTHIPGTSCSSAGPAEPSKPSPSGRVSQEARSKAPPPQGGRALYRRRLVGNGAGQDRVPSSWGAYGTESITARRGGAKEVLRGVTPCPSGLAPAPSPAAAAGPARRARPRWSRRPIRGSRAGPSGHGVASVDHVRIDLENAWGSIAFRRRQAPATPWPGAGAMQMASEAPGGWVSSTLGWLHGALQAQA
jgi:hypothetical protein